MDIVPFPGGAGGGGLEIGALGPVSIGGSIKARGFFGFDTFGAGGGSGGGILLHGPTVTLLSGVIDVAGGVGGSGSPQYAGGGGGAGGRVHVLTEPDGFFINPGFVVNTAGGFGGAPNGSSGGSGSFVVGILGPPPVGVEGCIEVSGTALVGATVRIRQRYVRRETTTDSNGCYAFEDLVHGRPATITIKVPRLP